MPRDSPPYWLRPVHRWFFWWEDAVPSVYRVAAVVVAAAATAATLTIAGLHPLIGGPAALAVWVALAVVQEHDERVTLPVDEGFQRRLQNRIDPVLSQRGFVFNGAFGPCRARSDRTDVFLYERPDATHGCVDLWIHRNLREGSMRASLEGRDLSGHLPPPEAPLARRLTQALDPAGDVDALATAIASAHDEFWE